MIVSESKDASRFLGKPPVWVYIASGLLLVFIFLCGPTVFFALGIQYKDKGWTETSRVCLKIANLSNPWSPIAKKAEAYMKVRLPRHNISEQAQQANIEAYNLDAIGKTDDATALFENTISEFPDFEWPYNNLAGIKLEQGKLDEAKILCEHALKINPDYANAHVIMAQILAAQGQEEAARIHKDKAEELIKSCAF
ncbi:MAG: tetratricopeptide repeat protein [Candidatus Obscuribacterales bacterium]|nr:tetratricopeptide repeat protein [Candidatus Obscuribacterales bacterium]